ncbi:ornithine carbamoyltransferase [Candidatus Bathyarchaeota archaeon ex4484_135]|nr:MAG: ornithine carbamoyltransferase [Candidatus Bathyarchaeota archaeon ex4484_135]
MKRDLLTLQDLSNEELMHILTLAREVKTSWDPARYGSTLSGRTIALLFQKPSTRTRVSFEVAIRKLGGDSIFLSWHELQLSRGETVSDTARVLERYVDGIVARVGDHQILVDMAENARIPVINALSNRFHPCQIIADLLTIWERFGALKGIKLAYVGDGTNVCNSLLVGCTKVGMDISVACPVGYEPDPEAVQWAFENASRTGSTIIITDEPLEAVKDAHVIYTDTFMSMHIPESEREKRFEVFVPRYQVRPELFEHARPDAVFMHCLPAHRGEEVVSEVIDGPRSIVFDQAENRLHAQVALFIFLYGSSVPS